MCGIAGLIGRRIETGEEQLSGMVARLAHRGPDRRAQWIDPSRRIALGHARLAIIDLSPSGDQPMLSTDGRFRIVTNGEIYNYLELREELRERGRRFRGTSDTEVMLAAFCEWGVEGSLERFNGMFAFAVWDHERRVLTLARDRIGEKPLYFARLGETVAFSSELAGLAGLPGAQRRIDTGALASLLSRGYIPAPHTIYRDVSKLPAGCLVEADEDGNLAAARRWWDPRSLLGHEVEDDALSPEDALEMLDRHLHRSIELRLLADVPVGAFLSGGVDSSLVVAVMQSQRSAPVRTFTVGFEDPSFDEAPWARRVADHLGTDHTELRVTADDVLQQLSELPASSNEPFADPSQVPVHLVSRMARRDVKVVLSGDGGDELFGGYPRYAATDRLWRRLSLVPASVRVPAGRLGAAASQLTPVHAMAGRLTGKVARLSEALQSRRADHLYELSFSNCPEPERSVLGGSDFAPRRLADELDGSLDALPLESRWRFLDLVTYLPDDILVKLDRATMRHGLEGRVPFLDHELVRFAWRLPMGLRRRDGQSKWLLRRLLERYVPPALVERPKAGFELPLGSWLRGPLRSWCESLLDPQRLRDEGLFDHRIVTRRWREHLSEARDWRFFLWSILVFQVWNESRGPALLADELTREAS